jgi:hypothetical protein
LQKFAPPPPPERQWPGKAPATTMKGTTHHDAH